MSSRITCDWCRTAHSPIAQDNWQRLVALYMEQTMGVVPLRLTPSSPTLKLFVAACEWAKQTPGTPGWALDIAHEYGAPVVDDLERAASEAMAGDYVIHDGDEYVWDGWRWR